MTNKKGFEKRNDERHKHTPHSGSPCSFDSVILVF